jgi:hypothetical protein
MLVTQKTNPGILRETINDRATKLHLEEAQITIHYTHEPALTRNA